MVDIHGFHDKVENLRYKIDALHFTLKKCRFIELLHSTFGVIPQNLALHSLALKMKNLDFLLFLCEILYRF
jgi:hypothetical protein